MPQPAFKVDQIQIEPGGTGIRRIRSTADGALEFVDTDFTNGVSLKHLAGLDTLATGVAVLEEEEGVVVELPFEFSSSNYVVHVELDGNPESGGTPWITDKSPTGFKINFAAAVTLNVRWLADGRLG